MGELGDLLEQTVKEWEQNKRASIAGETISLKSWVQQYTSLISEWPTSSYTAGRPQKERKDELAEAILEHMNRVGIDQIQTEQYILCKDYTAYVEKPVRLRAIRILKV
jgi:hypothetical protein